MNGVYTLTSSTVKEDGAKDTLPGDHGRDWYLSNKWGAVVAQRDQVVDSGDNVSTEIHKWL